jgi:hypothetical protein
MNGREVEYVKIKLSEIRQKGLYILCHPVTNKPVRVTEENASFFEGLPLEFKRDGSLMVYKYIFCPSSVVSIEDSKDPGMPISFYLIKEVPNFLEGDEFDTPPSQDKLDKVITNLNSGYACYHASCLFNTLQRLEMANQMCFVSAGFANPQAQFEFACKSTDNSKKLEYFKLAAKQGNPSAQFQYALMRYKGEGDKQDLVKALKYFKLVADQGNPEAQFNYALMSRKGEGDEPNFVEALKYYKSAADQGHRLAQFNYALMCRKGEGDEPNLVEALNYFKLAAKQGNPAAQFQYASMRYKGEGDEPNLVEALKYYKSAADQGDPAAQFQYASMRYKGEGDEPNLVEALNYFKLAAKQGESHCSISIRTYAL